MGNCEERLISKPQEEEKKLGPPLLASDPASASDLDPPTVETLGVELPNLRLEDEENQNLGLEDEENQNLGLEDEENQNLGLEDEENQNLNENENQNENPEGDREVNEETNSMSQHPLRPSEPDCVFYVRTGTCRYGLNCRFNHPPREKEKVRSVPDSSESVQEKENDDEEHPEREGLPECKYYLKTGGCKFGKACRYHHPREKTVVGPPLELNFLGLPIRPGEKECLFYMRMGSCKFATNCRFHHPDPTASGGTDLLSGYQNGGSVPLNSSATSQPDVTSWSLPRTPNEPHVPHFGSAPSYVPMMFSPPQLHPNLEWNGYQAPVSSLYPPPQERTIYPPSAPVMNDSNKNTSGSKHHHQQQQMHVDEFPERPGQRECKYFMKTGDCKYRSACRFHHPKNRIPKSPVVSPVGLPLRPDQTICTHYSRHGICKFGSACKYNHPPNHVSSGVSASNQPQSLDNEKLRGSKMTGYGHGSESLIQQLV